MGAIMVSTEKIKGVDCMQAGSTALKDDKKINAENNTNYSFGSAVRLAA